MLRILLCGLILFALPVHAQDDDAERAGNEKQAQQKLEQVRSEIRALSDALRATSGERSEASEALRAQETAISTALGDLEVLDQALTRQQAELDSLEQRRAALARTLQAQREALGVLLRSAYALGRSEELKLLLQQDDVGAIARVLAYHRYFQRARVDRIDGLLADLRELADLQTTIEDKKGELEASRKQREADIAQLQVRRDERETLLASIDTRLGEQKARLALMARDEKGLVELLARLRDVFADIPKQLDGSEPFARLRGRLPPPLAGKIRTAFGGVDESGRPISGILINAASGSPVKAIARGRVAYADWLKGYGMLLILDHGDGYMSLYGYNDSLRKEVGDWVSPGETIATSGASGGQKSPALYFELRLQGKPINPKSWLR